MSLTSVLVKSLVAAVTTLYHFYTTWEHILPKRVRSFTSTIISLIAIGYYTFKEVAECFKRPGPPPGMVLYHPAAKKTVKSPPRRLVLPTGLKNISVEKAPQRITQGPAPSTPLVRRMPMRYRIHHDGAPIAGIQEPAHAPIHPKPKTKSKGSKGTILKASATGKFAASAYYAKRNASPWKSKLANATISPKEATFSKVSRSPLGSDATFSEAYAYMLSPVPTPRISEVKNAHYGIQAPRRTKYATYGACASQPRRSALSNVINMYAETGMFPTSLDPDCLV